MKDLQLKKILTEMSKMKTKILDNIDENNNLFENVPGDNPPLRPEVVVKRKTPSNETPKDGNPQLEDFRIISCIDGQTYIGGTGLNIQQKKETISSSEWLNLQKEKYDSQRENWITACEYNADIKMLQGAASYGLDKEMTEDQKALKKSDLINECLSMCYNVSNNLPIGCATLFDLRSPDQTQSYPIALTHTSWLRTEYKSFYDRWKEGDPSYVVREPFQVYAEGFEYRINSDGKWSTIDIKDVTKKSEFESGLKIEKQRGRQSKYDLLPLTDAEKTNMTLSNPFYENNRLKLGDGQYICIGPNASSVNYRTSAAVNEDTGFFDPEDNWVSWSNSTVVGKLISTILSTTPEFVDEQGLIAFFTSSQVESEQSKKFNKYLENNFTYLVNTLIKILNSVPNGNETVTSFYQLTKKYPGSTYATKVLFQPFFHIVELYDKLPEDIKKNLTNTGIVHKWYKVKLLYPIDDKTDPGNVEDVVYVAADTTEYCKSEQEDKKTVSNSSFDLETLKRAPMKSLVVTKR